LEREREGIHRETRGKQVGKTKCSISKTKEESRGGRSQKFSQLFAEGGRRGGRPLAIKKSEKSLFKSNSFLRRSYEERGTKATL